MFFQHIRTAKTKGDTSLPKDAMKRCLVAGAAAAVLFGGADAFAPSAGALRAGAPERHASCAGAPALRMGLGDMFSNAFANNPNIPKAPVTGPGSPGFSPQKSAVESEPEPEPKSVWEQVLDPASGNPYWWNTETGETSWTPPAAQAPAPPPAPTPPAPTPAVQQPVVQTNTVVQQAPVAEEEPEEDLGPTGPSLERQLINLNKFLVNGIIDQDEYERQKAAIKAQMPEGPVFDADALANRPFKMTTMKWGALVDTKIPQGWVEGQDYDRQTKIGPGSLVGINRSDGSIRFGQVVKKGGLVWEDRWKVVVSVQDNGKPGATREEDAVMLLRPTQAGLAPVLEAMPDIEVKEEDVELTLNANKKGLFGDMFAAPVYEGGSSASLTPIQPPSGQPAKAVVPQGIIPKAAVPPGVVPTAVPPQGSVPTAVPPPGVVPQAVPPPTAAPPAATPPPAGNSKTSEWI